MAEIFLKYFWNKILLPSKTQTDKVGGHSEHVLQFYWHSNKASNVAILPVNISSFQLRPKSALECIKSLAFDWCKLSNFVYLALTHVQLLKASLMVLLDL